MAIVEAQCDVTPESAGRLDQVVRQLTGHSRAEIRGLFHHGCVRLNGQLGAEPGTIVKAGDAVAVRHDPHTRYREPPRQGHSSAFRLVFEDAYLLVVDKAARVLTVPTDARETNTLVDAVNRHLNRSRRGSRASVVHRLDRGTSGLLVFAKSQQVAHDLQSQFRVRKAEREYAAIVVGTVVRPEGTFSSRMATSKSLQRYSVQPGRSGETAVTHYRVERPLRGATYVRVRLETGRRNQIRVHFAEAGHPVLGDKRYRNDVSNHRGWVAPRLALHADVLGFTHPRTHVPLRFTSHLPDEFEHFLARHRVGV